MFSATASEGSLARIDAHVPQRANLIPFSPTFDDLSVCDATASDPFQRKLTRPNLAANALAEGLFPGGPTNNDHILVATQLLYDNAEVRQRQAVERSADLDCFGTHYEIGDHSVVVHIFWGEQFVSDVEVALIPNRLDRSSYKRFVY
jgi:hypothetical protein